MPQNIYTQDAKNLTWDTLKQEYLRLVSTEEFGTPFDAKANITGIPAQNPIDKNSDFFIFTWHLNKINNLIKKEIESVDNSSHAMAYFVIDMEILKNNFASKICNHSDKDQDINKLNEITEKFMVDAKELLQRYTPQNESNKKWTPFVKNMLLLLSVIGTIPALYSIGSKVLSNEKRYAFFDPRTIKIEHLKPALPSQDGWERVAMLNARVI